MARVLCCRFIHQTSTLYCVLQDKYERKTCGPLVDTFLMSTFEALTAVHYPHDHFLSAF